VEDESRFYTGLGRSKQIKNPEGVYSFTLDEALEAIRAGKGDGIGHYGGLFGARALTGVWKFEDEDVARRVREKTLKGFATEAA
jgi:hypothetical protein